MAYPKWVRQPPPGTPLKRRYAYAYVFDLGAGLCLKNFSKPTSNTGAFSFDNSPVGPARTLLTADATVAAEWSVPTLPIGTEDFTTWWLGDTASIAAAGYQYATGANAALAITLAHGSISYNAGLYIAGGFTNSGISITGIAGIKRVIAVRRAGNLYFYVNGSRSGGIAASGSISDVTSFVINNYTTGTGNGIGVNVHHIQAGVEARAWSESECNEWLDDPWSLYQPIQRRIYVGPSASANVTVNSGLGALTVTGLAPTLRTSTSIAAGLGALTITGYAPTVRTSTSIATGVGALSITGLAPSLSTATSIATSAGALAITGYAPTVSSVSALTAAAGLGQLSVTGYAPTVTVLAAGAVTPDVGSLSITGLQPAISLQERIATGVAALEIVGYAPTVSSAVTIQTGVGALTLAGYAPTAESLNIVTAGVGGIVITGYEPTITGGEAVPTGRADAGAPGPSRRKYNSKNRRRKPLLVTIDGQDFVVSSEAEAEALVEQAHEAAEEAAQSKAAEVVKKRLAKQAKDGRLNTKPVELDQPTVEVKPAADGYIDRTWLAEVQRKFDEEISEAYQEAAQQAELQILLRRQEELDDEDRLVALLFTIL